MIRRFISRTAKCLITICQLFNSPEIWFVAEKPKKKEYKMTSVKYVKDLTVVELRNLIREIVEDALEDLEASLGEKYLKSIEEARKDYRDGRITPLEGCFNV